MGTIRRKKAFAKSSLVGGGQQQRVAVARGYSRGRPAILLARTKPTGQS